MSAQTRIDGDPLADEVKTEQRLAREATADLVKALGSLAEPRKGGKAEITATRRYTYLTLPDLLEAVRPVLAAHNLAVMQEADRPNDTAIRVTTLLVHANGHTWQTPPLILSCGRSPQDVGSALTYARRYQLATMVGLAGADDDDAQQATHTARQHTTVRDEVSEQPRTRRHTGGQPFRGPKMISEKQQGMIRVLIAKAKLDPDTVLTSVNVWLAEDGLLGDEQSIERAEQLSSQQASHIITRLQALTKDGEGDAAQ